MNFDYELTLLSLDIDDGISSILVASPTTTHKYKHHQFTHCYVLHSALHDAVSLGCFGCASHMSTIQIRYWKLFQRHQFNYRWIRRWCGVSQVRIEWTSHSGILVRYPNGRLIFDQSWVYYPVRITLARHIIQSGHIIHIYWRVICIAYVPTVIILMVMDRKAIFSRVDRYWKIHFTLRQLQLHGFFGLFLVRLPFIRRSFPSFLKQKHILSLPQQQILTHNAHQLNESHQSFTCRSLHPRNTINETITTSPSPAKSPHRSAHIS